MLQEGLDPKIKAAKQAELTALQQKQQQHQQAEKEKKLATKYHKVCVWWAHGTAGGLSLICMHGHGYF